MWSGQCIICLGKEGESGPRIRIDNRMGKVLTIFSGLRLSGKDLSDHKLEKLSLLSVSTCRCKTLCAPLLRESSSKAVTATHTNSGNRTDVSLHSK
ncbi:hypothetical protein CEXT_274551 [Caerostris extrusa]|uniref:Uncharacterized protein n=1 Tax=Caerostris extrusa TaxID=172846 RepID=A0AAV4MQ17_CAEEX|nr:hypothetical protein CEXT_274551 [Caerostris extrusa]